MTEKQANKLAYGDVVYRVDTGCFNIRKLKVIGHIHNDYRIRAKDFDSKDQYSNGFKYEPDNLFLSFDEAKTAWLQQAEAEINACIQHRDRISQLAEVNNG